MNWAIPVIFCFCLLNVDILAQQISTEKSILDFKVEWLDKPTYFKDSSTFEGIDVISEYWELEVVDISHPILDMQLVRMNIPMIIFIQTPHF